jgi:molybdopterin converting factor small subunit
VRRQCRHIPAIGHYTLARKIAIGTAHISHRALKCREPLTLGGRDALGLRLSRRTHSAHRPGRRALALHDDAHDDAPLAELELELADADSTGTSAVVSALQKQYPQLERILPRCALAINGEYVTEDAAPSLKAGDEVAVLPPMSGG